MVSVVFDGKKYNRWNGNHALDSKGQVRDVGKDVIKQNSFVRSLFGVAA